MSATKIRVITESEELHGLKEVWDGVLQRCNEDSSVYLTHEWVWTWWKHFGEGKILNILIIEREGQVIGIIPLMRVEHRMGFVKVCSLETIASGNCNHVGLILPESREEAMAVFLAYLERELARNGLVVRLTCVPEDSNFLGSLRTHSRNVSKALSLHQKFLTFAPYVSLPATWDEYFGSLSHRRRKTLRRALRSLEDGYAVEFRQLTTADLEQGLSEFFDLHQARWEAINVSGVFSDPRMKDFYREMAGQFIKKDWLHLSCLSVDGKMVAATYGFVYDQKLCVATAARDIQYSKHSVGHLLDMYLIKDAIEKRLRECDFLRGAEPYKFHWTKSGRRYMQITMLERKPWFGLKLKSVYAFLRLLEIRQYRWRELYSLYRIRRREKRERKKMGLGSIW